MRQPVTVTVTDADGRKVSESDVDYATRYGRREIARIAADALGNGCAVTTSPKREREQSAGFNLSHPAALAQMIHTRDMAWFDRPFRK